MICILHFKQEIVKLNIIFGKTICFLEIDQNVLTPKTHFFHPTWTFHAQNMNICKPRTLNYYNQKKCTWHMCSNDTRMKLIQLLPKKMCPSQKDRSKCPLVVFSNTATSGGMDKKMHTCIKTPLQPLLVIFFQTDNKVT